ncbi:hypothetical protein CPLU01_11457 [Colletotrichum plurivorum]|uniref:Uncharacterized protein n=1 Tax=Colletotrichum plurivorum TaxID=2175906 RepID=A0A8H6K315_9PEZI|nr:hypothetical protein CPLU01_11457 [Colletotrichum plurivorum]
MQQCTTVRTERHPSRRDSNSGTGSGWSDRDAALQRTSPRRPDTQNTTTSRGPSEEGQDEQLMLHGWLGLMGEMDGRDNTQSFAARCKGRCGISNHHTPITVDTSTYALFRLTYHVGNIWISWPPLRCAGTVASANHWPRREADGRAESRRAAAVVAVMLKNMTGSADGGGGEEG